jgi:2-keto-3-deoxy-L-rhamnonate aldolase RhmA
MGAQGIMVPAVESAEEASRLVNLAKFPPHGNRRFGLIYPDQLPDGLDVAMARANDDILLLPQIETVRGVEQVYEIAAVDGIDVLWLGPYDLTIDMGITGRFDDATYRRAVERFLDACQQHGKTPGVLVESPDDGHQALFEGFRCLMYSFDAALYSEALARGLHSLRNPDGMAT